MEIRNPIVAEFKELLRNQSRDKSFISLDNDILVKFLILKLRKKVKNRDERKLLLKNYNIRGETTLLKNGDNALKWEEISILCDLIGASSPYFLKFVMEKDPIKQKIYEDFIQTSIISSDRNFFTEPGIFPLVGTICTRVGLKKNLVKYHFGSQGQAAVSNMLKAKFIIESGDKYLGAKDLITSEWKSKAKEAYAALDYFKESSPLSFKEEIPFEFVSEETYNGILLLCNKAWTYRRQNIIVQNQGNIPYYFCNVCCLSSETLDKFTMNRLGYQAIKDYQVTDKFKSRFKRNLKHISDEDIYEKKVWISLQTSALSLSGIEKLRLEGEKFVERIRKLSSQSSGIVPLSMCIFGGTLFKQ